MPDRQIPALVSTVWLSIASSCVQAESQAEYAEKAHESWQQQNKLMEESYSRLLSEAEAEPNKEPARQLKQAKEQWVEFRNLFCKSVSQTYGGQWQSVRESECRVNLANQLKATTDTYGW
ncbi:hypothetical protein D9M68_342720 [compost metagenome]